MSKLIRDQDFIVGLVFISFGVGYVLLGQNLPFGNPRRMGPAFFPFILAGILVSIGLMLALKALRKRGELVEAMAVVSRRSSSQPRQSPLHFLSEVPDSS